jgi:hypothetical protein
MILKYIFCWTSINNIISYKLVSMSKKVGTTSKSYHGFLENINYSKCIITTCHVMWMVIGGSISTNCWNRNNYLSYKKLQISIED